MRLPRERVPFDARLPLGMFDETAYAAAEFQVLPGDRLLFISDGVHATSSRTGERYGDRAPARAVTAAARAFTRTPRDPSAPRAGCSTGRRGRPAGA